MKNGNMTKMMGSTGNNGLASLREVGKNKLVIVLSALLCALVSAGAVTTLIQNIL